MSAQTNYEVLEAETRTDNFPPLKNDLMLRAARGEITERTPVWMMRQAGRYLPEYMEVRKKHGFVEKCRTPVLACELTLQPLRRFAVDAAIIFSDILVVPEVLGLRIKETPNGPKYEQTVDTPDDLSHLDEEADVDQSLGYVFEAITLTRHRMKGQCVLVGFSGAPWTLMAYMIEGGSSPTASKAKKWLYRHPEPSHELLQMLTNVIVKYLVGQVKAGAQMLQVFESQGGILGPEQFRQFSVPYLEQIARRVKEELKDLGMEPVPMCVFGFGSNHSLSELSQIGYGVVGIDWRIAPQEARKLVGPNVTLQGNLDPCLLYAPKEDLKEATRSMLEEFGTQRYIANLGHGVLKDTDPQNVQVFVDTVHQISAEMNSK